MEQRIELKPNCSLSPRAPVLFLRLYLPVFLGFCLILHAAAVSGRFCRFGRWKCWLSGLALHASMQRRQYTQTVLITDSQISLVTRSRHGEAKQEFARHWAKVRLRSPPRRHGTSRLTIESHGRACEVGSFLTEEDRCRLAERLRNLVGGMNESPPLEIANIGDPFR